MDSSAVYQNVITLIKIKEEVEDGKDVDLNSIIQTMMHCSLKDLYFYRDCIDLMIIYNKN